MKTEKHLLVAQGRAAMTEPTPESKKIATLVAALAIAGGLLLVSASVHLRQFPLWSIATGTLGVAILVSVSTSVLHRWFVRREQQLEMQAEVERRIHRLLNERFDLLDACTEVGFQRIHPKWSSFCENVLPQCLRNSQQEVVAVGIGLSGLSHLFVGGALREVVDLHLRSKKKMVVCSVDPKSIAAQHRESEVGQIHTTTKAIEASLAYFEDVGRANPGSHLQIKVLRSKIPKAAMILIDNQWLFYSPYFSAWRTPSSFVVETHKGDELFEKLLSEIKHHLKDAVDWKSDNWPSKETKTRTDQDTTLPS